MLFRHLLYDGQQLVVYRRAEGQGRSFATGDIAFDHLVDHRGGRIVCHVRDDGNIGFEPAGDHLGAAQPHFFLYGIDHVKAEGQFLFVLFQQPRNLGDHETADAVVEGTADEIVIGQLCIAVLVGDDGADMDAEIFQLLFGTRPGIEEEVVDLWVRFLGIDSQAGMDRGPAEDGRNGPFFAMDEDALSRGDLVIDATIAFEIEQAFGRHIVDEPADLIGVRFDDDLERRFGVDDAYGRAIWV